MVWMSWQQDPSVSLLCGRVVEEEWSAVTYIQQLSNQRARAQIICLDFSIIINDCNDMKD